MTLYRNVYILFILFVAIGLNGCYKEPVIPNSLLPPGCRIAQIATIDFNKQDSLDYQYDRLGNRTIERFNNSIKRVFKFDSNGLYINSQQIDGVTLAYQYDSLGSAKRINRISGGAFSYDYTYEGDNIKTYKSTEGGITSTYSFTNGKLTDLTVTPGTITYVISNEKIAKASDAQGNIINYTYANGEYTNGQLTQAEYIYAAGNRKVITYAYDGNSYYGLGWLLARGFPGDAKSGQPGPGLDNFGGSIQANNLIKVTTQLYKKSAGVETPDGNLQVLTYQHQYNGQGFSLGYGRSDGMRVRYRYANCPNE